METYLAIQDKTNKIKWLLLDFSMINCDQMSIGDLVISQHSSSMNGFYHRKKTGYKFISKLWINGNIYLRLDLCKNVDNSFIPFVFFEKYELR